MARKIKDLKCAIHLLSEKFGNMSDEKKAIVRNLGFGGLMYILPLRIFRRFQGKTLKNLTDEMMSIGVGNEQDRLMFKRIFILYIQMVFLLPTTINKISPVHLAPIYFQDGQNKGGQLRSTCFEFHHQGNH
ncbi:hypothetical protein Ahy_A05g023167 [Arachis hypogaea]|uniref:Uncharacterized protein n=1 Tax=Arachis hypogaea TaxID=3818 RepID=A0A445D2I2_ARAHY|nr:hypothetical protein Ahy_A05g023167 [Arachis hypogaea]